MSNDFIKSVVAQKLADKVTKYDEIAKDGKFYPSMLNELGELNLLLLEKMYNTFESKADKVFFFFRKPKFAYLWPRIFKFVGDLP